MDANAPALHPELVPIADLTLDPDNAKRHGERNIATIRSSLVRFRQRKAIVVNRRTMRLEAGEGTLRAAIGAGATEIVAVFVDDDDATAAAYALADNRTSEIDSGWDLGQVEATIAKFDTIDWGDLGLGDADRELLSDFVVPDIELPEPTTMSEHERGEGDEEPPIPELPAEPITKLGEVITIGRHTLHCIDCMELMRSLPDNSVDGIACDPPYGLSPDGRARTWDDIAALRAEGKGPSGGFMGSAWDAGVPGISWARECLRVLMPGGYMVAFSATRTIHRLACAVEDAGFEIIDQLAWLQWEGMPRGMNVSLAIRDKTAPATDLAKAWDDYHTRLKSCSEPIVLAQKPIEGTVVENIKKWGTGALNIGATRHPEGDPAWPGPNTKVDLPERFVGETGVGSGVGSEVTGKRGGWRPPSNSGGRFTGNVFQYPKPSTREKTTGTDDSHEKHTTVKPVAAMRRLVKLIMPPGGGVLLEPFGGSGTTAVAAPDDVAVIIAEREPGYCDIIRARVGHSVA
jgi:DNA modification methylase